MKPQISASKFKYSCRLDKAVLTKEDYIEELEMRFEEAADIWHLTNHQIYGHNGYIMEIQGLKNKINDLEKVIKKTRGVHERTITKE